jgi:hypothetical protein
MNFIRASAIVVVPCILLSTKPVHFSSQGSPQECEVIDEVKLMYPEASIKLRSPKNSCQSRVKTANKVS